MNKTIIVGIIVSALSGCSWLNPYDDESNCAMNEDHGKCASARTAYDDAVNGGNEETTAATVTTKNAPATTSRNRYETEYYNRLKNIIDEPEAPLTKPEKTIRGLVLPYGKEVLYGQRHIYVMVEKPEFVIGDYLIKPKNMDLNSTTTPTMIKPMNKQ